MTPLSLPRPLIQVAYGLFVTLASGSFLYLGFHHLAHNGLTPQAGAYFAVGALYALLGLVCAPALVGRLERHVRLGRLELEPRR